jgi:endonuclease I
MRPIAALLVLLLALSVGLSAAQPEEPQVAMNFVKTPLVKVLELYGALVGRPVQVGDDLRERPVSINTKGEIPRSAAIKVIESRLGNYDIRIVERDGELTAVVPEKGGAIDPDVYYAETAGLDGEALKSKLQDITSKTHKTVGYGPTKEALRSIDEDPSNTNNVMTFYGGASVPKENFVTGDESVAWDREHVLPQTYGAEDGRFAKSDLHNLFPCLRIVNSTRDSLYFDESDQSAETPEKAPLCSYDDDSWEPPDDIKGDIARIIFYMDVRYDGSDSSKDVVVVEAPNIRKAKFGKLSTLLQWHENDPVSDQERERNGEVFETQGNRNPFVDRPDLAGAIYAEGQN